MQVSYDLHPSQRIEERPIPHTFYRDGDRLVPAFEYYGIDPFAGEIGPFYTRGAAAFCLACVHIVRESRASRAGSLAA